MGKKKGKKAATPAKNPGMEDRDDSLASYKQDGPTDLGEEVSKWTEQRWRRFVKEWIIHLRDTETYPVPDEWNLDLTHWVDILLAMLSANLNDPWDCGYGLTGSSGEFALQFSPNFIGYLKRVRSHFKHAPSKAYSAITNLLETCMKVSHRHLNVKLIGSGPTPQSQFYQLGVSQAIPAKTGAQPTPGFLIFASYPAYQIPPPRYDPEAHAKIAASQGFMVRPISHVLMICDVVPDRSIDGVIKRVSRIIADDPPAMPPNPELIRNDPATVDISSFHIQDDGKSKTCRVCRDPRFSGPHSLPGFDVLEVLAKDRVSPMRPKSYPPVMFYVDEQGEPLTDVDQIVSRYENDPAQRSRFSRFGGTVFMGRNPALQAGPSQVDENSLIISTLGKSQTDIVTALAELNIPFQISEQERTVVQLPDNVLLIGRSGTGKTTCAVFRLWARYHAFRAQSGTDAVVDTQTIGRKAIEDGSKSGSSKDAGKNAQFPGPTLAKVITPTTTTKEAAALLSQSRANESMTCEACGVVQRARATCKACGVLQRVVGCVGCGRNSCMRSTSSCMIPHPRRPALSLSLTGAFCDWCEGMVCHDEACLTHHACSCPMAAVVCEECDGTPWTLKDRFVPCPGCKEPVCEGCVETHAKSCPSLDGEGLEVDGKSLHTSASHGSLTIEGKSPTGGSGYHHVFVTLAPVLCNQVQRYYHTLSTKVDEAEAEVEKKEAEAAAAATAAATAGGKSKLDDVKTRDGGEVNIVGSGSGAVFDNLDPTAGGAGSAATADPVKLFEEEDEKEDGDGSGADEVYTMHQLSEGAWPVFLTLRRLLVLLDGTLRRPFIERDLRGKPVIGFENRQQGWSMDGAVSGEKISICRREISADDLMHEELKALREVRLLEEQIGGELSDDMLAAMAGGDVNAKAEDDGSDFLMRQMLADSQEPDERVEYDEEGYERREVRIRQSNVAAKEVTYDLFEKVLWPIMNKASTSLHPSLVYQEIMSSIQGSVESLETIGGFLSPIQYYQLGKKRSTVSAAEKPAIYAMYMEYRKLKFSRNLFDWSEVVHHIHVQQRLEGYSGPPVHAVTIDEVQDFSQATLRLLFSVCRQPDGFFFTGDTCQTIARGVGFRFCDLQTLFSQIGETERAWQRENAVPSISQLTRNYRSHTALLNFGHSVIELLEVMFPATIDKLVKDDGIVEGPYPLLLDTTSLDDLFVFLSGSQSGGGFIEFGAEQVVIVRTQEDKEKLPALLKHALCLTVFEAKGLEFSDVILYNFFSGAPEGADWRVLNSLLALLPQRTEEQGWQGLGELVAQSSAEREGEGQTKGGLATSAGGSGEKEGGVIGTTFDEMGQEALAATSKQILAAMAGVKMTREQRKQATSSEMMVQFKPNSHAILCSEMKQLYTAATRAKKRLFVYDSSSSARAPMFKYWTRRALAKLVKPGEDVSGDGTGIAQATSPEAWRQQGMNMMRHRYYAQAQRCFEYSGDEVLVKQAVAYQAAASAADELAAANFAAEGEKEMTKKAAVEAAAKREMAIAAAYASFRAASDQFQEIGAVRHAAKCLFSATEFEAAARMFREIGAWGDAGVAFLEAAEAVGEEDDVARAVLYEESSECLLKAQWWVKAANVLERAGKFGEVLEVVGQHRDAWEEDDEVVDEIIRRVAPLAIRSYHGQLGLGDGDDGKGKGKVKGKGKGPAQESSTDAGAKIVQVLSMVSPSLAGRLAGVLNGEEPLSVDLLGGLERLGFVEFCAALLRSYGTAGVGSGAEIGAETAVELMSRYVGQMLHGIWHKHQVALGVAKKQGRAASEVEAEVRVELGELARLMWAVGGRDADSTMDLIQGLYNRYGYRAAALEYCSMKVDDVASVDAKSEDGFDVVEIDQELAADAEVAARKKVQAEGRAGLVFGTELARLGQAEAGVAAVKASGDDFGDEQAVRLAAAHSAVCRAMQGESQVGGTGLLNDAVEAVSLLSARVLSTAMGRVVKMGVELLKDGDLEKCVDVAWEVCAEDVDGDAEWLALRLLFFSRDAIKHKWTSEVGRARALQLAGRAVRATTEAAVALQSTLLFNVLPDIARDRACSRRQLSIVSRMEQFFGVFGGDAGHDGQVVWIRETGRLVKAVRSAGYGDLIGASTQGLVSVPRSVAYVGMVGAIVFGNIGSQVGKSNGQTMGVMVDVVREATKLIVADDGSGLKPEMVSAVNDACSGYFWVHGALARTLGGHGRSCDPGVLAFSPPAVRTRPGLAIGVTDEHRQNFLTAASRVRDLVRGVLPWALWGCKGVSTNLRGGVGEMAFETAVELQMRPRGGVGGEVDGASIWSMFESFAVTGRVKAGWAGFARRLKASEGVKEAAVALGSASVAADVGDVAWYLGSIAAALDGLADGLGFLRTLELAQCMTLIASCALASGDGRKFRLPQSLVELVSGGLRGVREGEVIDLERREVVGVVNRGVQLLASMALETSNLSAFVTLMTVLGGLRSGEVSKRARSSLEKLVVQSRNQEEAQGGEYDEDYPEHALIDEDLIWMGDVVESWLSGKDKTGFGALNEVLADAGDVVVDGPAMHVKFGSGPATAIGGRLRGRVARREMLLSSARRARAAIVLSWFARRMLRKNYRTTASVIDSLGGGGAGLVASTVALPDPWKMYPWSQEALPGSRPRLGAVRKSSLITTRNLLESMDAGVGCWMLAVQSGSAEAVSPVAGAILAQTAGVKRTVVEKMLMRRRVLPENATWALEEVLRWAEGVVEESERWNLAVLGNPRGHGLGDWDEWLTSVLAAAQTILHPVAKVEELDVDTQALMWDQAAAKKAKGAKRQEKLQEKKDRLMRGKRARGLMPMK